MFAAMLGVASVLGEVLGDEIQITIIAGVLLQHSMRLVTQLDPNSMWSSPHRIIR